MSHFITEPINFAEVTRLLAYPKKAWLKATLKEIKNLINNQTFLIYNPDKVDTLKPYIDVYKAKPQSDGILDKLKLIIVVRGDFQNK